MRRPSWSPLLTQAIAAALAGAASACVLPTYDESPPPDPLLARWSRSAGGLQDDQAVAIAAGPDGGVLVGGRFASYMSFDGDQTYLQPAGAGDAFVASYDAAGRPRWSVGFGDAMNDDAVVGIAAAPDGDAVIIGSFRGTITLGRELTAGTGPAVFVARLDGGTGAVEWSTALIDVLYTYGATPGGVALDADDNVLVTGSYAGEFQTVDGVPLGSNSSTRNAFVIKLDPGGAYLWIRDIDDTGSADALAVATDSDREVLVAGYHQGSAYLNGMASPTPDGSGAGQMFVAKYGPDNEFRWGQSFAALADTDLRGTAIAVDAGDAVLVAGDTTGELPFPGEPRLPADARDAFVLKLGPAGNYLWHHLLDAEGAGAEDTARSIRAGADGAVFLAGNSIYSYDDGTGMMVQDHDVFLAKLDGAAGERAALELYGGEQQQIAGGMDVAPGGALVLTGAFSGELDLGEGPLPQYGPEDIFVAKRPAP